MRAWLTFSLNVVIGLTAILPTVLLHFLGEPYQRGFYCDDETLGHPYKDSTITTTVLIVVSLTVPLTAIVVVETFLAPDGNCRKLGWKLTLLRIVHFSIMFLFGCAVCQTMTDAAKYAIGRLRPHFFHVCRPNWPKVGCKNRYDLYVYVEDYECPGNKNLFNDESQLLEAMEDMRLSFLSGHASFSFQAMTFYALYLQARILPREKKRPATLFVALFQFLGLMFAFYTSLSRISDYKHHPGDVLSGGVLGVVVGVVNAVFVARLFDMNSIRSLRRRRKSHEDDEDERDSFVLHEHQ